MKKINEEIVKYISGFMSVSEIENFEKKLLSSQELNEQYEEAKKVLADLKIDGNEVDENYFTNLVPRIRNRLASKKKSFLRKRIYYLAPAFTVILLVVLFFPRAKSNSVFDNNYKELAEVVVNNIHDDEVTNKYLKNDLNLESTYSEINADTDFSVGLLNSYNQIPESYLSSLDLSNTETRQALSGLDDADLEKLYHELNEINFK